jgi:hypothetical protein
MRAPRADHPTVRAVRSGVFRMLAVAVAAVGVVALSSPQAQAAGPYTNTSTPVRHCTYLPDASCAAVKWTIPANVPVTMKCWTDESSYAGTNRWFWIAGNGVEGFVSANQISGQVSVGWCNGMPQMQAVRWAGTKLNELYRVNECLLFVREAWLNWGSGIDIGSGGTAVNYWNTHGGHQSGTNPPVGALVFWNSRPGYPEGHVAISIGSGYTISTYERSTQQVHAMNINERNQTHPYLGYIMPTW